MPAVKDRQTSALAAEVKNTEEFYEVVSLCHSERSRSACDGEVEESMYSLTIDHRIIFFQTWFVAKRQD